MICPNCGQPLPDTAKMCYSCRTKFQQEPKQTKLQSFADSIIMNDGTQQKQRMELTPKNVLICILALILAIIMFALAMWLGEQANDNIFAFISTFYQYI